MLDKTTLFPETALQMTHRVAKEQAAILVAQEKMQAYSYPMLYATFIVFELIQLELFQARYSYRDSSYEEQKRIVKESFIAAEYYRE